jgi:tetratricopeptide (TPR) repeat protein
LHADAWHLIIERLAQPLGNKWPYDDLYYDSNGEKRVVRKTLLSLCQTSRLHREVANKSLYRSICLESGESAFFLWRTLFKRPSLRNYVRELVLTGPVKEDECRKAFIDGKQRGDRFCNSLKINPKSFTRWKNQYENSPASEEASSSPTMTTTTMTTTTMATTTMARIFLRIPRLRCLVIKDTFIPHHTACETLESRLLKLRERRLLELRERRLLELRDENTCDEGDEGDEGDLEGYILPELSTLVILGESSTESTPLKNDWPRLFLPHSKAGIKNIHLVRASSFTGMPSSIDSLNLYTLGKCLGLEKMENLTSLNIFSGEGKTGSLRAACLTLRHLPPTLQHLRFDSGYCSHFGYDVTYLQTLSMLTQLTSLQLPMALLFGKPDNMDKTQVLDMIPTSLRRLVLMEVWPSGLSCYESGGYGEKMGSCLERIAQELRGLDWLEFREQWPYWRHALAKQNKPLPVLEITDLFPNSSSFLCKCAAAYKQEDTDDALELASRAAALEPQNREALLCLSQIQAGIGQPEAAMKTLAGLNPPAHLCVSGPIKVMLDHVNIARKCLREDPKSALEALNEAMGGLVNRNHAPREWNLMKSEAYLSICPNTARDIAQNLLRYGAKDVEALLLAGRASCELKEYKSATQLFQKARCYDPKRLDVVEWLNASKNAERGDAAGH